MELATVRKIHADYQELYNRASAATRNAEREARFKSGMSHIDGRPVRMVAGEYASQVWEEAEAKWQELATARAEYEAKHPYTPDPVHTAELASASAVLETVRLIYPPVGWGLVRYPEAAQRQQAWQSRSREERLRDPRGRDLGKN